MTQPHEVQYQGETIQVWQEPTGQWHCCIVVGESRDIGPNEVFNSLEAAVDAAKEIVDEEF